MQLFLGIVLGQIDAACAVHHQIWVVPRNEFDRHFGVEIHSILPFDKGLDLRVIAQFSRRTRFDDAINSMRHTDPQKEE